MLIGIGVGVPGAVDDASGIVRFAPNLGWRDLDLLPILADAFAEAGLPAVPIHLRNEAHVAALGEYEFGGNEGDGPLVFVSCDVGVGAGVILDDGLFGGAQGMAGEIGHTVIQIDGPRCSCGRRGCAEAFLGERALAGEGAMDRAGTYLGVLLQNLWVAFNPRRIVLGGSSCVRHPELLDAARATLAGYGESAGIAPPEVQAARDGLLAPAVGAAALTLHSELRPLRATSVVPPQPRGSGTKPGKGSGSAGRRHGRGMTPLASRFSTLS
jgi:predicted NBD/HSP70 family sugar kinase